MILALDPSSQKTGYALLTPAGTLTEHGLLKPRRIRDDANARIDAMVFSLREIVAEYAPDAIIIEDTSGKVGARHKGNGAGLAIHGKAVGRLHQAAIDALGEKGRVVMVLENDWTRRTPKAVRQNRAAYLFPDYKPAADKGGDMADAIMLGVWWINRQRFVEGRAA